MLRTCVLICVVFAWAPMAAASEVTLLRVFLNDGTALVSYGEFARVDDRVVFSMPVGGSVEDPRLHVVSLPAQAVDWSRTERYGVSARYQQYASTRGEDDFIRLGNDVARVLNDIALTKDPASALQMAEQARKTMAEWPAAHYGYRQRDVREIVALLDEAIGDLRANAGVNTFDVALVANVADIPLEPLLGMPAPREMLEGIRDAARMTDRSAERVSLLESALLLLHEAAAAIPVSELAALRKDIQGQIRNEQIVDQRYARMVSRLLGRAQRASERANVRDVISVISRIPREDAQLGLRRPEVVQALHASVQAHLDAARQLRLLRDRWSLRRSLYRDYQRAIGSQLLQLVKAQPALDAIRRLDGPPHQTLWRLNARFAGGAEQLQRFTPPEELRGTHDMLIGAWRFAEQAIGTRQAAVTSGSVETAWTASSAAAGSLMLLAGAQQELRSFLEPPRLK